MSDTAWYLLIVGLIAYDVWITVVLVGNIRERRKPRLVMERYGEYSIITAENEQDIEALRDFADTIERDRVEGNPT